MISDVSAQACAWCQATQQMQRDVVRSVQESAKNVTLSLPASGTPTVAGGAPSVVKRPMSTGSQAREVLSSCRA